MSAPNDFGSNKTKAQIALIINEDGSPVSTTAPMPIEIIYQGAPVGTGNPLPITNVP